MEPTEFYIHELMIRKLAGKTSEEEDLYLNKLMEEDADVNDQFEKIKSGFTAEDLENQFARLENDHQWVDIPSLVARSRRQRMQVVTRYTLLLTAAIAGIIVYVIFFRAPNAEHSLDQSIAKQQKRIELRLAGGAVVNLSQDMDTVQVGDAKLNNANNTLTYHVDEHSSAGSSNGTGINSLTVPPGMNYRVVLSDGTEVWLNSSTTLQFPFTFKGGTREIFIKGEAYLKVAKDASKPFIVHLNGNSNKVSDGIQEATVQVLGTEFNVISYDNDALRVSLVEGAVKFKVAGKEASLKPGIEAAYETARGILMNGFDEDEVTGWKTGRFYFNEATLQEIVAVLPRLAGVEAVIDDQAIGKRRFSGVFNRNRPIIVFLNNLKETMQIGYYYDSNQTLHFK